MTISFLSPEQYAIYSVAFFSVPVLYSFYEAIFKSILPVMSQSAVKSDSRAVAGLWRSAVERTSAVSIPCLFLVWIMAKPIINVLFTSEYVSAASYYRIYILTLAIHMLGAGLVLRAFSRTMATFWTNLVSAVVTIISAFVLTRVFGVWGAVATAVLGAVLPNVLQLVCEAKLLALPLYAWLPLGRLAKQFLICMIVGLPVWLFGSHAELPLPVIALICGGYLLSVFMIQELMGIGLHPRLSEYMIKRVVFRFRPKAASMELGT